MTLYSLFAKARVLAFILACYSVLQANVSLAEASNTQNKAQAKTILVLGDSISAAYGMAPEKGWVHLLQQALKAKAMQNYRVVNASVSGNTSGDGLARLAPLLTRYQPHIVIVELGGNDGLRGYPIHIMSKNLQKIIDLSQSAGAKVLLAGIEIPPNYGQRYTDAFRDAFVKLNEKNTLSFLPFILEKVATEPTLMQADQIHPTAEAQPIILENVWVQLEKLL